ncbi:hypothetical protein D915_006075 [Fasciola hepatica]|uniref:Mitotic spindle assembly checkpoint protein MAD1 n=1 Tax=Fasciola hepatica TaxID=6192 RepID=A0A4E0RV62_FASHE|nr:hypothetical protein D915_006075 [Fasciola hepatica]
MLQRFKGRSNPSEHNPFVSSSWTLLSAQKRSAECALIELQNEHDRKIKQCHMEKMDLESEKIQLEQSVKVLKVKNESLLQERDHTTSQLHDSEKRFDSRISDVLKVCNNVESSLTSEVERLREETMNQQKRIIELEQVDAQNKTRINGLEMVLDAQEKRLKELDSFVTEKQKQLEDCDQMRESIQELQETKRNLEARLALQENRPSIPASCLTNSKGPTYVIKLEMENEKVKTAYKTLSKERADWLITKEENEELRTQVQQLKQWRNRALTAENALDEYRNLAELNNSSIADTIKSGMTVSPNHVGHLERENQLLLAESGELRGRVSELQLKLEQALKQLNAITVHRDKLIDHMRSGHSRDSVRWADADLLTTPIQKLQPVEPTKESELIVDLRHRICELEDQLNKSESLKCEFEEKVKQFELKGLHEPETTRILTLKANPSAEVREGLSSEVTRLRQENERFRQRIQVLEECAMRLRQCQAKSETPFASDEPTIGSVTMVVDKRLMEHPDPLTELETVRKQLRVEQMRGDRLMELFDKASTRFRGAFRELLGYRVDVHPSDEYKVRPVFASDPNEFLMFQRKNGQLMLKENEFSRGLSDDIRAYLSSTPSFPAFFAALTLSYVQQTTMVT